MTTALALIEAAMSKIGMLDAGETASAEDAALGLLRLNSLIDAWETESMFCYTTTDTVFTLAAGTTSMTIGPAMQIDMARPVRILSGSFGRSGANDYRLDPVSEPEYNKISLKSAASSISPRVCFYDGGTPTGILYFWPAPSEAIEVHLVTPEPGGQAVDISTSYLFPPGYQRALEFNLALELAADFGAQVSPFVMGEARNSKRVLKRTNARTPQLDLDSLASAGRGTSPSEFYGGY